MRIFLLISIFSVCSATLCAQDYLPSRGGELPGGRVVAYPTQQPVAAADNAYLTPLDGWVQDGARFTTSFSVPFAWIGRQVLLHVDHASADYEVFVDGRSAAYESNGSAPAEFDLTRLTHEGVNRLEIVLSEPARTAVLESWKGDPVPTLGESWISSRPTMYIRDVVVKNRRARATDDFLMAEIGIVVKSGALNPRTSRIHYELLTPGGVTAAVGHEDLTLDMRREDTIRFLARIPDSLQWSAARPALYTLRLKTQHEGRYVEFLEFKPGFRTVGVVDGELWINELPVVLRACEVSADIGAAEVEALRASGYNALRLLPGPVPESLFELCDRTGIYLIVTAPVDTARSGDSRRRGGNPSNDPAWQQACIERAEESYHTAKFHPSAIAFSLARKSSNGIALYEAYLHMKRFDESRPFIYPDAAGEWNSDRLSIE